MCLIRDQKGGSSIMCEKQVELHEYKTRISD